MTTKGTEPLQEVVEPDQGVHCDILPWSYEAEDKALISSAITDANEKKKKKNRPEFSS